MKRRYWVLTIGAILTTAVLIRPSSISSALQSASPAPRYITAPVDRGDIRTTLSATGTLNAIGAVRVSSQLSGQIAEVLVDFNDHVTKGQPLAKLDPSAFEARARQAEAALDSANARLAMAKAGLERAATSVIRARSNRQVAEANTQAARARAANAKRAFERSRPLVDRAMLSQAAGEDLLMVAQTSTAMVELAEAEEAGAASVIVAAEADHRAAAAQLQFAEAVLNQQAAILDQARGDLANTVIRAPTDGEVIGKDVDRGQIVAASLSAPTLFTLAQDLRQMEVHARVDEADIGRIRPGQAAIFTVDASPGRPFPGKVTQIRKAPTLIQNVVTYTVVLSAPNPSLLLPGMTALAQITIDQAADVLRIPNAALRFQPMQEPAQGTARAAERGPGATPAAVWVLADNGRATPVPVRLGRSNASATEIVGGSLHQGDQVIVGQVAAPAGGSFLGWLESTLWPRR